MCAAFFQVLFLSAFPLCNEVKFDDFSVLWLNVAYIYLHGKENRFKCLCGPKKCHLKVSLCRMYMLMVLIFKM